MKNLAFIIVSITLLGITNVAIASNRTDSIDDYLRPLIAKEQKKRGNSDVWENSENGGYLIRYQFDVTGDGKPEIFLTSSLDSYGRYGSSWKILDISSSGKIRPYTGSVSLSDNLSVFQDGKIMTLRCEWPPDFHSDEGLKNRLLPRDQVKHNVEYFVFSYPEIKATTRRITDEESEKLKEGKIFVSRKLEVMLLADYLTNPNATWEPVPEWTTNANGYFYRSEDKIRFENYAEFNPEIALRLLTKEEKKTKRKPPINQQESGSQNPRAIKNHAFGDNEGHEQKRSNKTLLWIFLGTVLSAALAWFGLRKKTE